MKKSNDAAYLALILDPIKVCARYKPKFGQGSKGDGLTLEQFQTLYQADSFYSWFGLDNPLMYAAHKAAGGMTSVYRQIGIGCEKLFRTVLRDSFALTDDDVAWSYEIPLPGGKSRRLYLDGRVPLDKIADKAKRQRFHGWMLKSTSNLGVDPKIAATLSGAVFEIRQGYKSKDSKRQNADIANASTAYTMAYLPCASILSAQIDGDILLRYRAQKWAVLTGLEGVGNPLTSTYDFMNDVVGYDLAAFFKRNRKTLRTEIDGVLQSLLAPETGGMSAVVDREALRQRADYTHRFNTKTGRHGWLRLTPAYSLKVVEELIIGHVDAQRVFDPFCGTGTTALSAAYHGHQGVTTDINPFLIWLARAKTANYSLTTIATAREACVAALDLVQRRAIEPAAAPPIFNIERWWSPRALEFLRLLSPAIAQTTSDSSSERNLLLVAFCRTLIEQSNAAFNHQSMSFKDDVQISLDLDIDMGAAYYSDVLFVLAGAAENPTGVGTVVYGDSRHPDKAVAGPFDLVITSPPYVNRMSYIRELRPYMYWLGFLENGRDAGELDWTAIGGTWGVATSRLSDWKPDDEHFESATLTKALAQISCVDNKNGPLLANYVAKYFDDMWAHFKGLTPVLAPGAELHYIVGNSTFYGSLVSAEQHYAEMLSALGFSGIQCHAIRKRNSKKELVEFDVVARWKK